MILLGGFVSLLGLGLASPLSARQRYPERTYSKGFKLVVNVTDTSRDFMPSIQNNCISSIHVGAGQSLIGVGTDADGARVFYQNGTAREVKLAESTVISDGGLPPIPFGISFSADEGSSALSTAHLNAGPGTQGVGTTRDPVPYAFLYPDTYAVCNESIPYYQGEYFLILKQLNASPDQSKSRRDQIPNACAPVRLLAECAPLNSLPPNSFASHEYAEESGCYTNVAAIDWKEFPPWGRG